MSTTNVLRNEMKNKYNEGQKYMLVINSSDGVRRAYAEAPYILGLYVVDKYGAEGIESFSRGDSQVYEIRNDHPRLQDGWFLKPVGFSAYVN